MSEVLQANIFFMITGIAVIVFTALLCVALFHVVKLLKSIRRIADHVESGVETVSEDMIALRDSLASGGAIKKIFAFLFAKKMGFGFGKSDEADVPKQPRRKKKASLKIKDES